MPQILPLSHPSSMHAQALPSPAPEGLVLKAFSELLSPGPSHPQASASYSSKADHWLRCRRWVRRVSEAGVE